MRFVFFFIPTLAIAGFTTSPGDAYPHSVSAIAPASAPAAGFFSFQRGTGSDPAVDSRPNPARGGSIVILLPTGWKSSFAPLADDRVATAAQDTGLDACQANASLPPVPFGPRRFLPETALFGTAASTIDHAFAFTAGSSSAGVSETVWIQLP